MYFEDITGSFGSIFGSFCLFEVPRNITVPGAHSSSRSRFPKSDGNSRNPSQDIKKI